MTAISFPPPTPFLVVFGRDKGGKPHASWFDQASADLARKAAVLMDMHAVPLETDALRELAGSLPRGRVFSSGRAFTPFVKGKLYTSLVELTRDMLGLSQTEAANETGTGTNDRAATAGESQHGTAATPTVPRQGVDCTDQKTPPAVARPIKRPAQAEDVGIGSFVLAPVAPLEGWYEAEVIGSNGSSVTLRYVDYPEEGTIVRRRAELGYLPAAPR